MIRRILHRPARVLRAAGRRLETRWFERWRLPAELADLRNRWEPRLAEHTHPRIAFVKQDVHDDLYCCPPHRSAAETIASTLMRTGPVELFRRLAADFHLLQTESDPECSVWQQKSSECGWCPLEYYERFRVAVPGRAYGQGEFAVPADTVEWGKYDLVVSVDVSVPARITRSYSNVVWAYYIREPKTSAYAASRRAPLAGQDLFLNQHFRRRPPKLPSHVLEFPYYFHSYGCFHDLFSLPLNGPRSGVFLDHHSAGGLSVTQLQALRSFGPVGSTAVPSIANPGGFEGTETKCEMGCKEVVSRLARSKYFLKLDAGRNVWGNALIEAVAAGCLALGDPQVHVHADAFSTGTSVRSFAEAIQKIAYLERNPAAYDWEVSRQRQLLDYLCFWRPLDGLLRAVAQRRGEE